MLLYIARLFPLFQARFHIAPSVLPPARRGSSFGMPPTPHTSPLSSPPDQDALKRQPMRFAKELQEFAKSAKSAGDCQAFGVIHQLAVNVYERYAVKLAWALGPLRVAAS